MWQFAYCWLHETFAGGLVSRELALTLRRPISLKPVLLVGTQRTNSGSNLQLGIAKNSYNMHNDASVLQSSPVYISNTTSP